MSHEHRYLVSFIVDNQPQSRTLIHDGETAFPELKTASLSDV